MKRLCVFIFLSIFPLLIFAHGITLTDHSQIKELARFRIMGTIELREGKNISAPVKYRTLNHEGGMKVVVMEILKDDTVDGERGKWLYVLMTSPMWVEGGEWLEKYQKFLIFLPDEMPVFDFEY